MGLINWIFDIYQHTQINQVRDEALSARAELAALRASGGGIDSERLEAALGQLALATKTVQRLVVAKGVCTPDELVSMMNSIDLEDGRADGRAPI